MPAILADDDFGQLGGVGQIPVVRQADAIRRVHIKRLSLGGAVASGGGIAHVTDAGVAFELQHVLLLKDVADQPTTLAYVELALPGGRDAGGVLPAVLQNGQRVVDPLIDRARPDDAHYSAHCPLRLC